MTTTTAHWKTALVSLIFGLASTVLAWSVSWRLGVASLLAFSSINLSEWVREQQFEQRRFPPLRLTPEQIKKFTLQDVP